MTDLFYTIRDLAGNAHGTGVWIVVRFGRSGSQLMLPCNPEARIRVSFSEGTL